MIVLVQSSFHTTWASLFEMELEPNLLDWNGNELELVLELEDMKRTTVSFLHLLANSSIVLQILPKHLKWGYILGVSATIASKDIH